MREIKIPNCTSDMLSQQVLALYNSFKSIEKGEKVNFNLGEVSWACPLIMLPLAAYVHSTGSTFTFGDSPARSYLDSISFPAGVDSVSTFEHQVQKGKNFVEAAMSSIKKQALLDPPYFVCPVFNELVLKGQKIGAFQIDKSAYIPLKTKQHLAEFQSGRSRSA